MRRLPRWIGSSEACALRRASFGVSRNRARSSRSARRTARTVRFVFARLVLSAVVARVSHDSAMAVVVCHGPAEGVAELDELARSGDRIWWTIASTAQPGDTVFFYVMSPRSAFVASGRVTTAPSREAGRRYGWPEHYMAGVSSVKFLHRPVSIAELKQRMPRWGWLSQPRRSVVVPEDQARRLRNVLQGTSRPRAGSAVDALEGIRVEVKRLALSRNRFLRDLALVNANGVCECCHRDYGSLGAMGRRVLQVHHRQQLSSGRPRRTSLKDLAVLCANCHLMAHTDASRPRAVSGVRHSLVAASSKDQRWVK